MVSEFPTKTPFIKVMFRSILIIALIFIFANAVFQGIQEKSFEPVAKDIGNKFFLASKNLQVASQEIIDNKGVYNIEDYSLTKIWNVFYNSSNLLSSIIIIITWIQVFMFIYKKSFFSDESHWFNNFFFSLITFIIIEAIAILSMSAINHEINSYKDVFLLISYPIISFYTFIKTMPYILSPVAERINDIYSNSISQVNSSFNIT